MTSIRNAEGEVINPLDMIIEHMLPGAPDVNFSADVVESFELNEHGIPNQTEWMTVAYVSSEHGQRYNTAREKHSHAKTAQVETETQASGASNGSNGSNGSNAFLTHIGLLDSDQALAAFDLDWSQQDWSTIFPLVGVSDNNNNSSSSSSSRGAYLGPNGLLPMNASMTSPTKTRSIAETQHLTVFEPARKHYLGFCNLFVHFCGLGQVGQRYGMSEIDFTHLLHLARLLDASTSSGRAECAKLFESFRKAGDTSEPSSGDREGYTPLLSRAEVLRALVQLGANSSGSSAPGPTTTGDRDDIERAREARRAQLRAGQTRVWAQVGAAWKHLAGNYVHYARALAPDPLLGNTLRDHQHLLKHIFDLWAPVCQRGRGLDVDGFVDLCLTASLVLPAASSDKLCLTAFHEAQSGGASTDDMSVSAEGLDVREGLGEGKEEKEEKQTTTLLPELPELCFPEFIEALCRVSLVSDAMLPDASDAKKVRMAFGAVAELGPRRRGVRVAPGKK